MSKNLESDHFKLLKDADQDVEDFVVERLTEPCPKGGEGSFTWDILHADTGVGSISSTSIFIPEDTKEMAHILMAVNMTKKVEEK